MSADLEGVKGFSAGVGPPGVPDVDGLKAPLLGGVKGVDVNKNIPNMPNKPNMPDVKGVDANLGV